MIKIKICGIICEFNPLHRGHEYLLQNAKRVTGTDKLVCIMSGNFVQRGQNAVYDKFTRAEAAIRAGADAVVELPAVFVLQSAEFFAFGGVKIAENIGCDRLLFGSECGDLSALKKIALQRPYAKNFNDSYGSNVSENALVNHPNNMLGVEYLRAIKNIKPYTLKRSGDFMSATELRDDLDNCQSLIRNKKPIYFESLFEIIKYKIISMTSVELAEICGVNEGLENKIKSEILNAISIDDLIKRVKSKRYAYSRISRILCCALLDIKKSDLHRAMESVPNVKMLAINKNSSDLLKQLKNYFVSSTECDEITKKDIKATEIYSIFSELTGNEDYTTPLIKI